MTADTAENPLLGITDAGDPGELYRLALRRTTICTNSASTALGWSISRASSAIRRLLECELLTAVPGGDEQFSVSTPRAAVARKLRPLNSQIEELERNAEVIRIQLSHYESIHAETLLEEHSAEGFRSLVGLEMINAELEAAADRCTTEVLTAQPGGGRSAETLQAAWGSTREMLERGVQMRTLYQHAARFNGPTRAFVDRMSGLGGSVRTLDQFFERLIIFDREVAFIPARGDRRTAIAVYQPAVVQFLVGVFEHAWLSASPFEGENWVDDAKLLLSESQATIVRLLAEGETDETIARRLGVSVRTCRTHIAKLYTELGARSRCQLGVLIVRSGLLDDIDGNGGELP